MSRFERLIESLESFAGREKGIERARAIKDSNLRQSVEEGQARLRQDFEAEVALWKQEAEEESQVVKEVVIQRRAQIDQAQITVRNEVIASVQAVEGQLRAQVQRRFMDAKKQRDSVVAAASQQREADRGVLGQFDDTGEVIEKKATSGVRAFPKAKRRVAEVLKRAGEDVEWDGEAVDLAWLEEEGNRLKKIATRFQSSELLKYFNGFPLVIQLFLCIILGVGVPLLSGQLGGPPIPLMGGIAVAGGLCILLVILYAAAGSKANRFAAKMLKPIAQWKRKKLMLKGQIDHHYEAAEQAANHVFDQEKALFDQGLSAQVDGGEVSPRYEGPEAVEARAEAMKTRLTALEAARLQSVQNKLAQRIEQGQVHLETGLGQVSSEQSEAEMIATLEQQFESLVSQWDEAVPPLYRRLVDDAGELAETAWLEDGPEKWEAPTEMEGSFLFGALAYKPNEEQLQLPTSERMSLEGPVDLAIPLRLRIPDAASFIIETKSTGREEAIQLLNFISLGWLAHAPAGRLSFSLFDPVGLGESFAGLMHLADYEEILINSRIRTREDQIEARLGELCEHMEKVIQMYLRNDYETITEYNRAAGTIAERYHFVVVADFPNGFTELALQRLLSIATSGARCGVFLLLHNDLRAEKPRGLQYSELEKDAVCLRHQEDGFYLRDLKVENAKLFLQEGPEGEEFGQWIHRIGEGNRDSNRIEVPFSFIAPKEGEQWTRTTTKELAVPIGRSGATKLQELALGKGTCQHALIAGKTGSGKSTLFHIIVTNLALWCDPDEVEFYLIDFKKGVEFKCYADRKLPHSRVIAIESDREFGLSVLQRLDRELRERGELFRAAGVQDVPGYRALPDAKKLPRTLLLIDEFQEYFIEDDAISQQAAVLLDRIVRQGRAFGIHAVLGSQTLGGAFTLARATLGQMTVRIALACNEADAYLIMDDTNPAPRLLTRPGEGIYNDRAGAPEANSPFQVVWLDEEERNQHLDALSEMAAKHEGEDRDFVVFEGNAPGEISQDMTAARIIAAGETSQPRMLLGAPNAIKDSTGLTFRPQSGANLLFVGPREDVVEAIVPIALKLLRVQLGEKARLIVFDPRMSENEPYAERVNQVAGVETPDMNGLEKILSELSAAMKAAAEAESGEGMDPTYLFIPSLHRHKKLRYEEDFSFSMDEEEKPSAILNDLISEGPGWGIHTIVSVDSLNNVNRCLGRKSIGEFEKKVLFQMSATDSASLIDSGAAAGLGLSRAVYYDESEGAVEIFRPYAEAPLSWFE